MRNKKFYDKKFLTRKTGKKNNKFTKVKKALRKTFIKRIFEIFASNLRFLKKMLCKKAINSKIWSKFVNLKKNAKTNELC